MSYFESSNNEPYQMLCQKKINTETTFVRSKVEYEDLMDKSFLMYFQYFEVVSV